MSPFFHPPPGQEYEKINAIKGEVIFVLVEGYSESNADVCNVLVFLSSKEVLVSILLLSLVVVEVKVVVVVVVVVVAVVVCCWHCCWHCITQKHVR